MISFIAVPAHCGGAGGAGGDGGGFFLVCEDLGKMFDHSLPACAFFFFFFGLKWRSAGAH